MKKINAAIAVAIAATLGLSACGKSGSPDDAADENPAAEYTVAKDVDINDSPTFDRIKKSGHIRVGMAFDMAGLSYKSATDDVPEGYNVEVAKLVAAGLGVEPNNIDFVETMTPNREAFLQNGQVDLVISAYTINDERKKVVDFAGPYYIAGQDLLVQASNEDISSKEDLAGKSVCALQGSTPAQNITENFPDAKLVTYDSDSKCLTDLQSGNVDAYTSDDILLRGYSATNEGEFRVVGDPFTKEPYGIGLPKDDTELRNTFNDILDAASSTESGEMEMAWNHSFGETDGYQDPEPDRY